MTEVTETLDPRALTRLRHETRMRLLDVVAVNDITPLMRRISLVGDLTGFASPGHADHIKAFIFPKGVEPMLGTIGERGAEFPEGKKPQMATTRRATSTSPPARSTSISCCMAMAPLPAGRHRRRWARNW